MLTLRCVQKIRMQLSWTRDDIEKLNYIITHLIDYADSVSTELDQAVETITDLNQELDQYRSRRHLYVID